MFVNGELIKMKINAGCKFEVRMGPNSKYDKFILEFRLRDYASETFINTTKFQALKYLTVSQHEAVEVFEYIYNILVTKKKSMSFGRYLDEHKKLLELCEANETYKMVFEARKNFKSLYFKKEG